MAGSQASVLPSQRPQRWPRLALNHHRLGCPRRPSRPPRLPALPTGTVRNQLAGFDLTSAWIEVSRIWTPSHGGRSGPEVVEPRRRAGRFAPLAAPREGSGLGVVLRGIDEYVLLQERTAIANREAADLFLSIPQTRTAARRRRNRNLPELRDDAQRGGRGRAENAASGQTAELPMS